MTLKLRRTYPSTLFSVLRCWTKRLLTPPERDTRPPLAIAIATTLIMAGTVAGSDAFAHHLEERGFVASWAVGHITPLPASIAQYSNQTLREIIRTSIGGDHVRVRIANTFGTETLVIGAASIALSSSGSQIVPGTQRVLTFVVEPAGRLPEERLTRS